MGDPFLDFVAMTRGALGAAGLERRELGGTVYWRGGDGPTLVLIHGVNDQAGTWWTVAKALAAKARLIILDLPGHGESAPSEGPIPMDLILDRLHAIIEKETRPGGALTLVGNSMGAWVALLYFLAHPERVSSLVLESGGGLARPLAVPLTATNREEALTILRAVHGPDAALPEWTVDALLQRAAGSPMQRIMQTGLLQYFVDSRLSQITVPTTLVWGKNDGVVPLSYAEALKSGIAGATLQVIDGAAHIPHAQQPQRFVSCLTATLSQNAPA